MKKQNYRYVIYINRPHVLYLLMHILWKVLLPKEHELVLMHCGFGFEESIGFRELADYFKIDAPEFAKQCYDEAIQKVREAISGSELEDWICYI